MSDNLIPFLFALVCGGFFILLLAAVGIFLIIYSRRSSKKADASLSWPATPGTVTFAEVKRGTNRDDDGNESYVYYPSVQYTYQVQGQSFTGRNIAFGGKLASNDPAQAEKELARYPLNGQVPVYYNPDNPSEAVLERKAAGAKWGLVVGIILLVVSICMACPLLIGIAVRIFPAA
jgi:hypothetical protein